MVRLVLLMLVGLLLVSLANVASSTLAQTPNEIGAGPRATCKNFREVDDATVVSQSAIATDGRDVYGLDTEEDSDRDGCDHSNALGDGPFATCANFVDQRHAQALLDSPNGDKYDLAVVNGQACGGPTVSNQTPTPTPVPSSLSTPGATGPTLGDRTCSPDRPQITTTFADVCAGSHARLIQPGAGTIDISLASGTITITPLQGAPSTLGGTAGTGSTVASQQEVAPERRSKRDRAKRKRQKQRQRQQAAIAQNETRFGAR